MGVVKINVLYFPHSHFCGTRHCACIHQLAPNTSRFPQPSPPAAARQWHHSPPQKGFTLIELLVVLVVMGIALGIVMVQLMPDESTALREEAARLALLLENAGLEARSSGRSMAWSSDKTHYRFWKKNSFNDWSRIDDDTSFRPRTLPEGMNINEVTVEEQLIKPGEYLSLSASAFALPFRIRMSNTSGSLDIVGKSTGEVVVNLTHEASGRAKP